MAECYLIVHKSRRVRVTKMKPNLKPGEVPIYVRMNIPDALFTQPSLTADIVIPDDVVKNQINADNVIEYINSLLHALDEKDKVIKGQQNMLKHEWVAFGKDLSKEQEKVEKLNEQLKQIRARDYALEKELKEWKEECYSYAYVMKIKKQRDEKYSIEEFDKISMDVFIELQDDEGMIYLSDAIAKLREELLKSKEQASSDQGEEDK